MSTKQRCWLAIIALALTFLIVAPTLAQEPVSDYLVVDQFQLDGQAQPSAIDWLADGRMVVSFRANNVDLAIQNADGNWTYHTYPDQEIWVMDMVVGHDDNIYMASYHSWDMQYNGVLVFNPDTGDWTIHNEANTGLVSMRGLRNLTVDADGDIWAASVVDDGGVLQYTASTTQPTWIEHRRGWTWPIHAQGNTVVAGHYEGISLYHKDIGWQHIDLCDTGPHIQCVVYGVTIDQEGKIWVMATDHVYTIIDGQVDIIAEGLASSEVVIDGTGQLWRGSHTWQLTRLNPVDGNSVEIDPGLVYAIARARNGDIWVGFEQARFTRYRIPPQLSIAKVLGQRYGTVVLPPPQRPKSHQAGQEVITYTIMVSNTGIGPAYDLVITDTLPAELTFGGCLRPPLVPIGGGGVTNDDEPGYGCEGVRNFSLVSNTIVLTAAELPPVDPMTGGPTARFAFTATVNAGVITNTVITNTSWAQAANHEKVQASVAYTTTSMSVDSPHITYLPIVIK